MRSFRRLKHTINLLNLFTDNKSVPPALITRELCLRRTRVTAIIYTRGIGRPTAANVAGGSDGANTEF